MKIQIHYHSWIQGFFHESLKCYLQTLVWSCVLYETLAFQLLNVASDCIFGPSLASIGRALFEYGIWKHEKACDFVYVFILYLQCGHSPDTMIQCTLGLGLKTMGLLTGRWCFIKIYSLDTHLVSIYIAQCVWSIEC